MSSADIIAVSSRARARRAVIYSGMSTGEWALALTALLASGFLAVSVICLQLHARLIRCLKSRHQVLWLDLGAPTWTKVLMTRGGLWGSPASGPGVPGHPYLDWLAIRGHRDIHDDEAARLGDRLKRVGGIGPSLLIVLVAALFFCVYTLRRHES